MHDAQRLKLIVAALAAVAFMANKKAQAAPLSELCWATISELRALVPSADTSCVLRVGQQGLALSFHTNAPLFEDPIHGKTYIAYLFGSLGRSLNKRQNPRVLESVEITNPALIRNGQAFHVQATDVKGLQQQAFNSDASVSTFYEGLILRGRLVNKKN